MDFSTRKFLRNPVTILTVLFLLGWLGVQFFGVAKKAYVLYEERKRLETELASLQKRKIELEAGLLRFQSDAYLEREAKRRLNLKKPGEKAVIIVPEEIKKPATTSPGLWQRIYTILPFFGD